PLTAGARLIQGPFHETDPCPQAGAMLAALSYALPINSVLLGGPVGYLSRSFQVAAISCKRVRPRHSTFTPGSPSPFRPRKPPNRPINRTASRRLGGCSGRVAVPCTRAHKACHSCSS